MARMFTNDPTDRFVRDWMKQCGIDERMVRTYRLIKVYNEPAQIELTMFVQDPALADVTSLDKPPGSETLPRVTSDNPNIIKEG